MNGIKYIWILLCFLILSLPLLADSDHDADEILLKVAPGVSIDTINARYNTTTDDVLIGGSIYKVKVQNSSDLDATVAAMSVDPDIIKVEYNFFGETPEGVRRTLAVVDGDPAPSKYQDQAAFQRISGPQAQTVSTGQDVVVAVIDTGVDYNHPDLSSHILRNAGNQVVGYDFVDNDTDPMDEANGLDDDNDTQIDEGMGHGTHVAGIIALLAPDCKIMPVRALNSDGAGTTDAVAKAIEWAVEYAKLNNLNLIINLSLGLPEESFVMLDAIQEALEEKVPIIASAGNDNSSALHYPAANDSKKGQVISVAGTGPDDVKTDFSNYGLNWIDVSAPALGIYSTFPGGQYAWWDGTSMSAPFVSGEAALVMSRLLNLGQDSLKLDQILPPIQKGVDYIYGINPIYKPGKQLGSGRINLYAAVQMAGNADSLTVKELSYSGGKLFVEMKSSKAPRASLEIVGYGKMKYDTHSNTYLFKKAVSFAPASITVTSSRGGIVNAYLTP